MRKPTFKQSRLTQVIGGTFLCAALTLPGALVPLAAHAQETAQQTAQEFEVPAGDLGSALSRFAAESGVVIYFDASLTQGKQTQGLSGEHSVEGGLRELLSGSGLSLVREADGSYRVVATDVMTLPPVRVGAEGDRSGTTEGSNSYTTGATSSATGLNLSIRDTPQSISVVTNERIQDMNMATVDDALRNTTGISVKAQDRGRNSLSSRGFDINNFQIDGVPFETGDVGIETFNLEMYDRVEVVRGATGLLSGAGDPSATVNLVRKHANSKTPEARIRTYAGSWNYIGGSIDASSPLNTDGSVRGRVVASYSEADAFIDHESTSNNLLYAIVDADLSEVTRLSFGASYEKDERNGIYWGKLPYYFSDGSRTDWDRSKTTATRWNQWDTEDVTAFTTLEHDLNDRWSISADASYYEQDAYSNLLWIRGNPDPNTGLGMSAYPYLYETNPKQHQISVAANGLFDAWGYEHEAIFRFLHKKSTGGWDNGGEPLSPISPVGNFFEWDGSYPEPLWDDPVKASRHTTTETAVYAATRLQLTDNLKAISGGRLTNWEKENEQAAWTAQAFTVSHDNVFTPYLGLVYDITTELSAYGSYSSIFKPQTARDRNGDYLDPLEGDTYEIGLKGELLDGALNATAAIFSTRQDNYAVQDGDNLVPGTSTFASRGVKGVESDGYELEVSGELTPNWNINLGWSRFSTTDPEGNDIAVEHPRKMLRFFTKYELSRYVQGLSVGTGVTWQDDEPRTAINPGTGLEEKMGEPAYVLVDLMVGYEPSEHWRVQLNANNLFDKEYKESSWGTFTYGEPRNIVASLIWKY